jgi:hypothetical protein
MSSTVRPIKGERLVCFSVYFVNYSAYAHSNMGNNEYFFLNQNQAYAQPKEFRFNRACSINRGSKCSISIGWWCAYLYSILKNWIEQDQCRNFSLLCSWSQRRSSCNAFGIFYSKYHRHKLSFFQHQQYCQYRYKDSYQLFIART